ncbi:MAG: ATP-binding protein [Gammaproteobacteria bacterium]
MKRLYDSVLLQHLIANRQMLFLAGPRQVGKTTSSWAVSAEYGASSYYLNWDIQKDRKAIVQGPEKVMALLPPPKLASDSAARLPIIIFDELHKYKKWKTFLKGFFDKYSPQVKIIVTGSARLDVYRKGGDSMMGRYFLYRLHPFSVRELLNSKLNIDRPQDSEILKPEEISDTDFSNLYEFGGFPEPLLQHSKPFYKKWQKLRRAQLFTEDLRDLTKIHDLAQMEILSELLMEYAGGLLNYSSLAVKINVSVDTIKRWITILKAFYFCFSIKPWTKNITRSLIKEPKIYLWDWSLVVKQEENQGAIFENFLASHLLKAVHFWTDIGLGEYDLYFLRDKEKREVDFLVVKDRKPWFLVEAKLSDNQSISKSLYHYQKLTGAPHAFQVVLNMPYVNSNCFEHHEPIIVPAKNFLSQLV